MNIMHKIQKQQVFQNIDQYLLKDYVNIIYKIVETCVIIKCHLLDNVAHVRDVPINKA